uniref:Acyltransferase 3 domain-containing protein n=1 Tax=Cyanothece sp. (strain PCC 7425 / ATCC 29141) TaxID=395961 RepID=B8HV86_CYAP4
MGAKQRFVGIDVFRGLAIFAVIVVHIDEGLQTMPSLWLKITDFASFCVPFFLAAAFYLAVNKLYSSQSTYSLRSRLARLLIPYAVWSVTYLFYKSAKFIVTGEFGRVSNLFQDPISLVFFGGVSFHLYFLPLLATGTLLIKAVEPLITREISLKQVGLLVLLSLLIYEVVLTTENGFQPSAKVAFEPLLAAVFPDGNSNPLLRWLLVELVWVIRCLPYIMVALLLNHSSTKKLWLKLLSKQPIWWVMLFLSFNLFSANMVPAAISEVVRGYTALIAAIATSSVLKENALIKNIGLCSFGIYLIHIFFVEVFQSVVVRLYPGYSNNASTAILLLAAALVFLASWGTTNFLLKQKRLALML